MQSRKQFRNLISRSIARAATAALAIATVFALTVILTQSTQAQTLIVLHDFTGGFDGWGPDAGLTMDKAGNLYGTASWAPGYGTVFELSHRGSGWTFNTLHPFHGGDDGGSPLAGVIFGPDGSLYGTTSGFYDYTNGTVFNLKPQPTACKTALCEWTQTVLYTFTGGSDGGGPGLGDLIFDQAGNLYGTTTGGGADGYGTVFELVPSQGGWTESVLYSFGLSDGYQPYAGVIFDNAGNLYSTTSQGGTGGCFIGCGTVFQLTPTGSGWTESVLYNFQGGNDGSYPYAGLISDPLGNLYGVTTTGGSGGGGTVFELIPSNGSWTLKTLYSFTGGDNCGSWGNLFMDGAGNLYGTTGCDGAYGQGSVFKLTPSDGSWTYTSLHDFTGGSDGGWPYSNVIFDAKGNLYGTASAGGTYPCPDQNCGVVWEITP